MDFEKVVEKLDQDERDYLAKVVTAVVSCFTDSDMRGLLVVGKDSIDKTAVFSINCDEMQASHVLSRLQEMFTAVNTKDAPPKEMFN
jgi:hypothetical protein